MTRWDRQAEQLSEQINQVRLAVERLTGHVDAINQRDTLTDRLLTDYETRLRSLERWRYALPTSVVLGLASTIGALIAVIHK